VFLQKAGQASRPISHLAFGSPQKLAAVVAAVNGAMEQTYPMVIQKLCLYLAKPRTRAALLKPIRSNIEEAHSQIRGLLQEQYSSADAARAPLHTPEELETILGGL
jgi:conserved oligomeric Golgi complex subunit 3